MLKLFKPLSQDQLSKYVNDHIDDMVAEGMAWHGFMKENGVEDD